MKSKLLFCIVLLIGSIGCIGAQTSSYPTKGHVVNDAIPGDNVLRFYRMAIPVTHTAFEESFEQDYEKVILFWREVETYMNQIYVPIGFCFEVIEDRTLIMGERNPIDENVYNAPGFGTDLLNEIISSSTYDIGMWVTYRDEFEENSGLSILNGAYMHSTKANGYAKTDKWVVAHEVGHLLGANHTPGGEGSLMDNEGHFLSYPSIKKIRSACTQMNAAYYSDKERTRLVGQNNGGNYVYGIKVSNSTPQFIAEKMNEIYKIPQGALLTIDIQAIDPENDKMEYMAIGCNSLNVDDVSEGNDIPHFASKAPQYSNIIEYKPEYSADIYYDDYFYPTFGTDIQNMEPGEYSISLLVRDIPAQSDWSSEAMMRSPFYSNYSIWEATVHIVAGEVFDVSLFPNKQEYKAGEEINIKWSANNSAFSPESKIRLTLSDDYGKSFKYTLGEDIPIQNGAAVVKLPNANIGNVEVDFTTAKRHMRGGIIRIEEIDGTAFTMTTLSPENGGGFTISGATETSITSVSSVPGICPAYDLLGRRIKNHDLLQPGLYISKNKIVIVK